MVTRPAYVPAPVADDLAAQDASLEHDCPRCGATPDDYCTNPVTDQYLHNRVSHWQRIPKAVTSANTAGNRDRNLDQDGGWT